MDSNSSPMSQKSAKPGISWILRMAWRDSRRNRARLLLFISSIVIGITALVAIYALGDNLRKDIDKQAATLVGADLVLNTNRELDENAQHVIDTLSGLSTAVSYEQRFASMVVFPASGGSRLVEIRALGGDFPYYGQLETTPATAGIDFRQGRRALVDKTVMLQFDAQVGDSVRVGALSFEIVGILDRAPGQSGISSTVAPAVFIPMEYLESTALNQRGSRINHYYYFQLADPVSADQLVKNLDEELESSRLGTDTVASRKVDTGRSFADLEKFLSLVGFIALLLGCVGVSSAIHIYVKEKITSIAILRCLGVTARQAFLIYLVQVLVVGLVGSIIGALLGTGIQQMLPWVLEDVVPVAISSDISWLAIAQGIGLGILISVLFALLPLVGIRNISPLNTLRITLDNQNLVRDNLTGFVYLAIATFIILFAYFQLGDWLQTVYFTLALAISFVLLYLAARLVIWAVRKFFPVSWNYLWRQGLANLFRPNNQTAVLVVAIGLGTAFISILVLVQGMLISRVALSSGEEQSNMVIFDIQTNQKERIAELTLAHGLPVLEEVPIVTVQLEAINGHTLADVQKDSTIEVSRRALGRELRVTYRETLSDSEKITSGQWHGDTSPDELPKVSLDEGYANRIRVEIGDTLLFNVQGVRLTTVVGSFREVDWNRVQTNFRLVFPMGVIDQAPQFHVLMTRVPDDRISAAFQHSVVSEFPNVSVIDLGLILVVLDEILDKIGFVIRFMGGFSILTGFVVLIGSVMISKYQRIRESVLLRTIGASRRQVFAITALEYFFLGLIGALTGVFLAVLGAWGLAQFVFEVTFQPAILNLLYVAAGVIGLTVLIGLANSRGVTSKPPLLILRKEG